MTRKGLLDITYINYVDVEAYSRTLHLDCTTIYVWEKTSTKMFVMLSSIFVIFNVLLMEILLRACNEL